MQQAIEMTDEQLFEFTKTEIDRYIDMGHFRNPTEARPYLLDGYQQGYKKAKKFYIGKYYEEKSKNDELVRQVAELQQKLKEKSLQ